MSNRTPTTTGGAKLPATVKTKNALTPFKRLADLADELVERYDEINSLERRLWNRNWVDTLPDDTKLPGDWVVTLNESDRESIKRAKALLDQLDREDLYDEFDDDDPDSGGLKRTVIAERLSVMLGAYVSGQPATPGNFVRMLLEHVSDANVSFLALHSACTELEAARATIPAISVVLTMLHEHEDIWKRRRLAIMWLAKTAADAAERLAVVRAKLASQRCARAVSNAVYARQSARQHLLAKQADAAKLAQEIADGFERLQRAEAELENAERDAALPPDHHDANPEGGRP
jgi:hypothetical protein